MFALWLEVGTTQTILISIFQSNNEVLDPLKNQDRNYDVVNERTAAVAMRTHVKIFAEVSVYQVWCFTEMS